MAVVFNPSSAFIDPDFHRAQPDCFIDDTQSVHFHLTEGFDKSKICKPNHGPALTATGTIRLTSNPGDLAGWDFGFIQVARANNMSKFYLGRTRKEGSIAIRTHIPPTLPKSMLLDGDSAAKPWIDFDRRPHKPRIAATSMEDDMSDHPSACASKIMRNDNTKCDNLLFHHITEYELWTTLCAKDPKGNFQQFAHFHWIVRWDQQFTWRGKQIMKGLSRSSITHDKPVLGPPTDPAVQALLKTPADPVAFKGFNDANQNLHKTPPNYVANPDWFANAPADFFIP